MKLSKGVRQTHRWLAIIFTVTVIANFVAISQGEPPDWMKSVWWRMKCAVERVFATS